MKDTFLPQLTSDLPEIYQPLYGHPELSTHVSRQCSDRLEKIAQVHDALQGLLGRPLRVLDLGCAQGYFSLSLAERGAIVRGMDFLDKNIAVCEALSAEHLSFKTSFEVDHIENVINHLRADQYDLVLGLSVFHHLVHEQGAAVVRELLDCAGACSAVMVLEFALPEEPLYWGATQPQNPRTLLDGCAFVHELARHATHLSQIPRPLYVASNQYWVLDGLAGKFDSWSTEPHPMAQGTHQGTRRYYFSAGFVVKVFRFDHQRGQHNRQELSQETQFLSNPPTGFPAPTCLASGTNGIEGWLVVQRLPGKLLLNVLREHTAIDHRAILRALLGQLTILEAAGLYHDDVRVWNVLLNEDGAAYLIDYGSISAKAQDCAWPENIFLAFFIFVRELVTGLVEHPDPLRTVSISPVNLPQPYRDWATSLWKRPLREWRFQLMHDFLYTLPAIDQSEELNSPQDAWARAIENAIHVQSQSIRNLKELSIQAEAQAQQASERAASAEAQAQQASERAVSAEAQAQQAEASLIAIRNSSSWRFTTPIRTVGKLMESLRTNFQSLLARSKVNQRARFFRLQAAPKLAEEINPLHVARQLNTIAVDLTPVLPGGENGGAKIFVLELLRRLAEMAPQTQFVLLTQAASHAELDTLDRPNMRRVMVVGPEVANTLRPRLLGLATRLLPHFHARLRGVVNRLGYKLNTALKRGGTGAMLRDMGVDLLFCPFTAPTYFEPGIPTVCTIYDLQYKTYPEFFAAEDVAHREHTFIEACRRAAALTAISDYSRDSAITHGNLDPERIRTIHLRMAQRIAPGVENGKAILDRLGLVPQRYLIYPANFWKHKNHEMLLTAFGIACHEGLPADIKLVCTGAPGARQAWLMNAARTMNLGDRILFPGYLPNAELAALMANCTGVVFPSLYEGFGLPVIEAMAAGVPVACSNTTSLPEVAAEAAILFDPRVPTQIAQAMISLVENDALRARLIQVGLQRAAEFSDTERMAREYWDLFQYARSNEKYENLLIGTYADGWADPRMSIQVAPEASTQTLELEFSAPEWLPQSPITIQTTLRGNPQGDPLVLQRGTSAVLSLALEPVGGCYEVVITPTFVPARSGHGDDQRELSVILQRCGIVRADGEYIELFPEKVSA